MATHGAVLISDPSPAIADRIRLQRPLTITFTLPDASGRFRIRQAPAYANAHSDGCGVPICVAAGPRRQGCAVNTARSVTSQAPLRAINDTAGGAFAW